MRWLLISTGAWLFGSGCSAWVSPADVDWVPRLSATYLGDPPVGPLRVVQADLSALAGGPASLVIAYDVGALEARVRSSSFPDGPAWGLGVRLLLGEVGPDRITNSRHALEEAVGVLSTVRNRLDPNTTNPAGVSGLRAWPGCGAGASFSTCARPDQYLGLRQWRALQPRRGIPDAARRREAFDVAVVAWWLFDEGWAPDPSGGAVAFAHRCGGAAHGLPMSRCDGDPGVEDVDGAEQRTGPIVFLGPGRFDGATGRYPLVRFATVDFEAGPVEPAGPWVDVP